MDTKNYNCGFKPETAINDLTKKLKDDVIKALDNEEVIMGVNRSGNRIIVLRNLNPDRIGKILLALPLAEPQIKIGVPYKVYCDSKYYDTIVYSSNRVDIRINGYLAEIYCNYSNLAGRANKNTYDEPMMNPEARKELFQMLGLKNGQGPTVEDIIMILKESCRTTPVGRAGVDCRVNKEVLRLAYRYLKDAYAN